MIQPMDAIKRAFTYAARIVIWVKPRIPPVSYLVIEKMMNNSITKICCYNFANYWFVNNKNCAGIRSISSAMDFRGEVLDICFGDFFVSYNLWFLLFTPASICIGIF